MRRAGGPGVHRLAAALGEGRWRSPTGQPVGLRSRLLEVGVGIDLRPSVRPSLVLLSVAPPGGSHEAAPRCFHPRPVGDRRSTGRDSTIPGYGRPVACCGTNALPLRAESPAVFYRGRALSRAFGERMGASADFARITAGKRFGSTVRRDSNAGIAANDPSEISLLRRPARSMSSAAWAAVAASTSPGRTLPTYSACVHTARYAATAPVDMLAWDRTRRRNPTRARGGRPDVRTGFAERLGCLDNYLLSAGTIGSSGRFWVVAAVRSGQLGISNDRNRGCRLTDALAI